jgi:hypothetical protein
MTAYYLPVNASIARGDRIVDVAESRSFGQAIREMCASDTFTGQVPCLDGSPVVLDPTASRAIATGQGATNRIEIRELRVEIGGGTIDEKMKDTLVKETANAVIKDLGELL